MALLTKTSNKFFEPYEMTARAAGPHVVIIGGIHGDEFEPILATLNLAKKLPGNLKKGKVTLLPLANPGAFEAANRCATDQLDLARTFPGQTSGSYTQKLASRISRVIQTADYLIDLHTGGSLFDILPLSGYLLHPDEAVVEAQQQMALAFGLPVIWGTEAQVEGRTLSVARDLNIPAIYAECRGGLSVNETTIARYEQGCMNVLNHLGLTKFDSKRTRKVTWLEDHTPGGGHLQSKMPSPADGIFVAVASIGQAVKKGSPIGYVVNPVLNKKTPIKAPVNGLLFMLRISAKVSIGDSLGGILPVSLHGKKIIYAK